MIFRDGGPCRDRTYDQLIKSNTLDLATHWQTTVLLNQVVEDSGVK
jgi:hypothetical protein